MIRKVLILELNIPMNKKVSPPKPIKGKISRISLLFI